MRTPPLAILLYDQARQLRPVALFLPYHRINRAELDSNGIFRLTDEGMALAIPPGGSLALGILSEPLEQPGGRR